MYISRVAIIEVAGCDFKHYEPTKPSRSSSSKGGKVKPPKAFTEKEELMGG